MEYVTVDPSARRVVHTVVRDKGVMDDSQRRGGTRTEPRDHTAHASQPPVVQPHAGGRLVQRRAIRSS